MTVSMNELGYNILRAVLLGLFLGASYDVIRIVRVMFGVSSYGRKNFLDKLYGKHIKNVFKGLGKGKISSVFVFITDIIYFTFSGAVFSVFLFWFNHGIFRWFIFLFSVMGFLIYYFTVGKIIIYFSEEISRLIMLAVNILIFLICLPFKTAWILMVRIYKKFAAPAILRHKTRLDIKKKKRYTVNCIDKLTEIVKFKV